MTSRPTDEDDQIARAGNELRAGTWVANARGRARRRKSLWNLLLPLFGLPSCLALTFVLCKGAGSLHNFLHPDTPALFSDGPITLGQALVLLPAMLSALSPAMMLTNFLVYLIPPARHAMGAEDRGHRGVDYNSSQRALGKVGMWIGIVCVPLVLLGASIP